jgi:hypothetical protein
LPYWEAIEYQKLLNNVYSDNSAVTIAGFTASANDILSNVKEVADLTKLTTETLGEYVGYISKAQHAPDVADALLIFIQSLADAGPIVFTDEFKTAYLRFILAKTLPQKITARDTLMQTMTAPDVTHQPTQISTAAVMSTEALRAALVVKYPGKDYVELLAKWKTIGYFEKLHIQNILNNVDINYERLYECVYTFHWFSLAASVRPFEDLINTITTAKIPGLEQIRNMKDYILTMHNDNETATIFAANVADFDSVSDKNFRVYLQAKTAMVEREAQRQFKTAVNKNNSNRLDAKKRCRLKLATECKKLKKRLEDEVTGTTNMADASGAFTSICSNMFQILFSELKTTQNARSEKWCNYATDNCIRKLREIARSGKLVYKSGRGDEYEPVEWVALGNWTMAQFEANWKTGHVISFPASSKDAEVIAYPTKMMNFHAGYMRLFLETMIIALQNPTLELLTTAELEDFLSTAVPNEVSDVFNNSSSNDAFKALFDTYKNEDWMLPV